MCDEDQREHGREGPAARRHRARVDCDPRSVDVYSDQRQRCSFGGGPIAVPTLVKARAVAVGGFDLRTKHTLQLPSAVARGLPASTGSQKRADDPRARGPSMPNVPSGIRLAGRCHQAPQGPVRRAGQLVPVPQPVAHPARLFPRHACCLGSGQLGSGSGRRRLPPQTTDQHPDRIAGGLQARPRAAGPGAAAGPASRRNDQQLLLAAAAAAGCGWRSAGAHVRAWYSSRLPTTA